MIPKLKAKELIAKFIEEQPISDLDDEEHEIERSYTHFAKRCAVIACNELIQEHTFIFPILWNISQLKYWNEVLTEIKLIK